MLSFAILSCLCLPSGRVVVYLQLGFASCFLLLCERDHADAIGWVEGTWERVRVGGELITEQHQGPCEVKNLC
jgi:hypothetical protein